jgi:hypothetical protein
MRARSTKMTEDVRVPTAGFFKCIREDPEPPVVQRARRQMTLVVGGLRKAAYGAVLPGEDGGRQWRRRAKGVAEHFADQSTLGHALVARGSPQQGIASRLARESAPDRPG